MIYTREKSSLVRLPWLNQIVMIDVGSPISDHRTSNQFDDHRGSMIGSMPWLMIWSAITSFFNVHSSLLSLWSSELSLIVNSIMIHNGWSIGSVDLSRSDSSDQITIFNVNSQKNMHTWLPMMRMSINVKALMQTFEYSCYWWWKNSICQYKRGFMLMSINLSFSHHSPCLSPYLSILSLIISSISLSRYLCFSYMSLILPR